MTAEMPPQPDEPFAGISPESLGFMQDLSNELEVHAAPAEAAEKIIRQTQIRDVYLALSAELALLEGIVHIAQEPEDIVADANDVLDLAARTIVLEKTSEAIIGIAAAILPTIMREVVDKGNSFERLKMFRQRAAKQQRGTGIEGRRLGMGRSGGFPNRNTEERRRQARERIKQAWEDNNPTED